MKKNILLLSISLLFFMAADAQEACEEEVCCYEDPCCDDAMHFYAQVLSGPNFLQSTTADGNNASYHTGYVISGSLGYYWHYGFRLEAEYAFRRNGISEIDFFIEGSANQGHFQTSSVMGNLFWDLPLCTWGYSFWNIQPFIGAGLGCDFQHMHSSNSRIVFDQKWNHFSWQMMAGLAYPIFSNTELSLEYRFHQGGTHFNNHVIGVGLMYKFGYIR